MRTRWTIWAQRPAHIVFCLLTGSVAWSATLAAAVLVPVTANQLGLAIALATLGIVEMELARQIERVRHRTDRAVHINMTSVWIFPGVLLLSPALVSVLVAVLHWHLYARGWYRLKRVPPFRTASAVSIIIVTCYAVHTVLAAMGIGDIRDAVAAGRFGAAAIAFGIALYVVVNAILIIAALYTAGRGIEDLINGWPASMLLELATLSLGALLAVILAYLPGLAGWIIVPVFVLHRAVLVEQLESAARQDFKTGVLNMAGWYRMAHRELAGNGSKVGVLMIDLDHFKQVNDSYGHLAGDAVLKAVADTISGSVRRRDVVGRFGGEEFVVLLAELAPPDIREIAERIRVAITRLEIPVPDRERRIDTLSASIGIATSRTPGTPIEQLLLAADAAVYRAKSGGRNRVEGDGPV